MKKIITKVLSVLMVLTMLVTIISTLSMTASAAADITVPLDGVAVTLKDADGDGYYEIGTTNDLYVFAAAVKNGYYSINAKLTADIVVNPGTFNANGGYTPANGESPSTWTPIGNASNSYRGIFDGNGKTVSGLYCDTGSNYIGLFGTVFGGTIKNVGVINSCFYGWQYVGGVVGNNNRGTVENCYNEGFVGGRYNVGGVVGYNTNGTVTDCVNTGTVSGTERVGGVVGNNINNATVTNCFNAGAVSGQFYIGGVVGFNDSGAADCYNTGLVSGTENVGGVVGYSDYGIVTDCYNADIGAVSGNNFVGGVVGYNNYGTVTGCYNADTGTVSGTDNIGGVVGFNNYGTVTGCYNTSTGTVSGQLYVGGVVGYNTTNATVSNCYNIGNVSGNQNVGGVVGSNYGTVTKSNNAGIVSGNQNVGGVVGYSRGNVIGCYNTGVVNGTNRYVGGVVGINYGEVIGCYNKGVVSSTYTSGFAYVGGVVGINYGTVQNCNNEGNVIGRCIGGVVGENRSGNVTGCYNTGAVDGTISNSSYAGGVVGYIRNNGTVTNCYNTGAVSGYSTVGGVVGYLSNGKVQYCYNIGTVSGTSNVGGAFGLRSKNGSFSMCCYLDTCGATGLGASRTLEQFASGNVAYLLNRSTSEGTLVWYQTIGTDTFPVQNTASKIVYAYKKCDNATNKVTFYTNDINDSTTKFHANNTSASIYTLNDAGNGINNLCTGCNEVLGTVTLSVSDGTYCGSEFIATLTKTGTLENVELSPVYSSENGKAPVNAGSYTASLTMGDATASVAFTVAPREVIISWENTYLMYNGEYQAPTAIASGLIPGDVCTITVDGAGKWGNNYYTAVATGVSNPNYVLPAYNTTCSYFIEVDGVKEIGSAAENIVDAIIPDNFTENVSNAVSDAVSNAVSDAVSDAASSIDSDAISDALSDAVSNTFDDLLASLYAAFANLFN